MSHKKDFYDLTYYKRMIVTPKSQCFIQLTAKIYIKKNQEKEHYKDSSNRYFTQYIIK